MTNKMAYIEIAEECWLHAERNNMSSQQMQDVRQICAELNYDTRCYCGVATTYAWYDGDKEATKNSVRHHYNLDCECPEHLEEKATIKKQFGSDYNRFVRQSCPDGAAKDLRVADETDPFYAELARRIKEGKIYMVDKEDCIVWKADNVVGYKQGLLIAHNR